MAEVSAISRLCLPKNWQDNGVYDEKYIQKLNSIHKERKSVHQLHMILEIL